MEKITVLFAGDQKMFINALASMLSHDQRFMIVGESANMEETARLAGLNSPGIVLTETNMVPDNGVEIIKSLLKLSPHSKIITLSIHAMPAYAKRMMRAGASGYVTKNSTSAELIEAMLEVYHGKKFICKEIRNLLSKKYPEEIIHLSGFSRLTITELDIINYIKEGLSSKEIAIRAGSTKNTIDVHRRNILKKLNLKNTATLVDLMNSKGL